MPDDPVEGIIVDAVNIIKILLERFLSPEKLVSRE
jgi:hypothetical protein